MVVSKVAEGKGNFGYDALKDEYTDLVKAGIIDPTKVTRYALQNAASVSTLLLTSDALIADMPKDDEKKPRRRRPRRLRRHVLSVLTRPATNPPASIIHAISTQGPIPLAPVSCAGIVFWTRFVLE